MNESLKINKYQDRELIAFDLYGTCIDHPFKNIKLSDNLEKAKELKEFLIKNPITLKELKENSGDKYGITDELIETVRDDIKGTFLLKKTLETLRYLKSKGYKLAVVSNLSKDYAEPLHILIPEGIFDHEVLSFDVGVRKPDPKIYEYLMEISKIDFKDMVFVGDTLKADVIGPNNMGITPIHVNRTEEGGIKEVEKFGIKFIQISTLSDLMKIL